MILKSHLCGVAVTFDRYDVDDIREPEVYGSQTVNPYNESLKNGRPQGSLYSQQKRKIADACEYMRLNAIHKPLIFVATSPGYTDQASEGKLIQKFTHNLRNGYDCKNYVWVREFTQAGYPHFHFVADMPNISPIALSLYWSGLFGSQASNSIRLGTAPRCSKCKKPLKKKGERCSCGGFGTVKYYLDNKQMAWYMTKYISKAIGNCEKGAVKQKKSFRTFAVSQSLARLSQPTEFKGRMQRSGKVFQAFTVSGKTQPIYEEQRIWQNCTSFLTDEQVRAKWNWRYTGFANTFKGFPKHWKLKKVETPKPQENVKPIECPF
jgi:hypothetical protein